MSRRFIVEADGGSRGNPGTAAGGAVVIDPDTGDVLEEIGVYVGVATNNVAEYRGMIAGLGAAFERDTDAAVRVRMDSKLVVEQMSGRWKIKHADMQDLARTARELISGREVTFEWIPRERNARADAAANVSMDRRASFRNRLDGDAPDGASDRAAEASPDAGSGDSAAPLALFDDETAFDEPATTAPPGNAEADAEARHGADPVALVSAAADDLVSAAERLRNATRGVDTDAHADAAALLDSAADDLAQTVDRLREAAARVARRRAANGAGPVFR